MWLSLYSWCCREAPIMVECVFLHGLCYRIWWYMVASCYLGTTAMQGEYESRFKLKMGVPDAIRQRKGIRIDKIHWNMTVKDFYDTIAEKLNGKTKIRTETIGVVWKAQHRQRHASVSLISNRDSVDHINDGKDELLNDYIVQQRLLPDATVNKHLLKFRGRAKALMTAGSNKVDNMLIKLKIKLSRVLMLK